MLNQFPNQRAIIFIKIISQKSKKSFWVVFGSVKTETENPQNLIGNRSETETDPAEPYFLASWNVFSQAEIFFGQQQMF